MALIQNIMTHFSTKHHQLSSYQERFLVSGRTALLFETYCGQRSFLTSRGNFKFVIHLLFHPGNEWIFIGLGTIIEFLGSATAKWKIKNNLNWKSQTKRDIFWNNLLMHTWLLWHNYVTHHIALNIREEYACTCVYDNPKTNWLHCYKSCLLVFKERIVYFCLINRTQARNFNCD